MFDFLKKQKLLPQKPHPGFFSTHMGERLTHDDVVGNIISRSFQKTIKDALPVNAAGETIAMDSNIQEVKIANSTFGQNVPAAQLGWYASQGFIGYQICAMISQHWLVDKVCTMPARDAARNGYDVTVNDGTEIDPKVLDEIKKQDRKYKIPNHLVQFVRNGRIFGVRIAMFKIESSDPSYYENPFNPDGIKPGSYKGIAQIDPYWITPELDQAAAVDPSSLHFYEPTWWRINGKRVHRTHLVIMKNGEVPDILKPSYLYGGIPVPQKIFERVYAAERTANEGPLLAMTKRLIVLKVEIAEAFANMKAFVERLVEWTCLMNNYGVKVIGKDEEIDQHDTGLADLDAVIMTQYQIVAAAGDTPATKLLGTTPKGFNSSGNYEEASYHEFLESVQTHDMTPLLDRHHICLIRSEIAPKFKIKPFETEVNWRPIDSPTAAEMAEINDKKADTDLKYIQGGALSPEEVRDRVTNDRTSGYNGIESGKAPEELDDSLFGMKSKE